MSKALKIGTRSSELAMWQAHKVAQLLAQLGQTTQIVPIQTSGDLKLDQPLYAMGITGIFTRALDIALLNKQVDITVHSLKDVPTKLPENIIQAAVLQRATSQDLLVYKGDLPQLLSTPNQVIATSSLRRKSQWLHRYPQHQVVSLRGNVNTRLQKLRDNAWQAAIFAAAGLQRINKVPEKSLQLDWMIPAPAQGAVTVHCLQTDSAVANLLAQINHQPTEQCTGIERQFLQHLEGGCTAPIGALAKFDDNDNRLSFHGSVFSLDGKQKIEVQQSVELNRSQDFGIQMAQIVLNNGGEELMQQIRSTITT